VRLPLAIACFLLFGCEAATRNKTTGAAVAVGAGVGGAAIYRAATGGCWAQCTHGKVCDRASGTCVEAADRPHSAQATLSSAADATAKWWEKPDPCPPGALPDTRSYEDDGRVMSCKTAEGVEDGRSTFFHTNGRKQMEGSYCAGTPCHVWTHWDEDGAVQRVEDLGEPKPVSR
jgi:hypothetical protein